ncbi:hypothetical protein [Rariglobus hedericola]|uniref:DUF4431 domain-containing protein n=1 Tax=Rariglobus hedericola TaxID=2597822 RepID=A0A556QM50_9BACT|nr:hypothetical protein [Rariglobus hedericola]TSJ77730.1 hypothetical protein FPL22_00015 [Rariglobus hedericola]
MKPYIVIIALTLACLKSFGADAPAQQPDQDRSINAPIGILGYYIGSPLTIEGISQKPGRGDHDRKGLWVDTIGEHKLDKPVGILLDNCVLPSNERCILKGYESVRWVGRPDVDGKVSQMPFQPQFYFIVTSVIQPQTLKIK